MDLLIYAATLGISYAVSYYFRFREREFRASQLEAQLVQAQSHAHKTDSGVNVSMPVWGDDNLLFCSSG